VNALSVSRLDLSVADAVTVRREIAAGQLEDARQIAAEQAARDAELDAAVDIVSRRRDSLSFDGDVVLDRDAALRALREEADDDQPAWRRCA
jgi:hypothetical protein